MTASHLLIVNPRSRGSTARRWRQAEGQLRAVLPPFDTAFTKSSGDASRLAAEAVGRYEVVVAVGGDGTTNEIVNGLVDPEGSVSPDTALGVIPSGTGGDFPRSLGIPRSPDEAATVLARGRRRMVDVGRARFLNFDGGQVTRYFINEAEVGMGVVVCQAVNRSSGRLGGAGTFLWGILVTMLRHRDWPVSFSVDGGPAETLVLNNAWIANGRFSGGGIRSAPSAHLDDGYLDLVTVAHAGLARRLWGMPKLRSGAFVEQSHVDYRTARQIEMTAETPVPVETDGEPVGTLPATFDLLPTRLTVIC